MYLWCAHTCQVTIGILYELVALCTDSLGKRSHPGKEEKESREEEEDDAKESCTSRFVLGQLLELDGRMVVVGRVGLAGREEQ